MTSMAESGILGLKSRYMLPGVYGDLLERFMDGMLDLCADIAVLLSDIDQIDLHTMVIHAFCSVHTWVSWQPARPSDRMTPVDGADSRTRPCRRASIGIRTVPLQYGTELAWRTRLDHVESLLIGRRLHPGPGAAGLLVSARGRPKGRRSPRNASRRRSTPRPMLSAPGWKGRFRRFGFCRVTDADFANSIQ